MKSLIYILSLLLIQCDLKAQPSRFWGQLAPGSYKIGYQDSILLNADHKYELKDYSGPKPYFVNMWFPMEEESGSQIRYEDYLKIDSIPEIQDLIDSVHNVQKKAFIHWVTYDLDLWESSAFNAEKRELVSEILNEKLEVSKTHQFPDKQFPTIIYHHGNGGISFENSVLFEYLASQGYVIISSDYHWPGLRNRTYIQKSDLSLEDVDFITNFSKTLPFTNHENLTYIGHSWGGGIALRLNQKSNPHFKYYIIFDSTIEKMVLPELKALNPHFDSLIHYHSNDFYTKSTVITARASYYSEGKKVIQPYPQFLPYQLIDTSAFTFITLKSILNHGSFTSIEVMRASLLNQFDQSDSVTLKEQYDTYQYLVQLTKDLMEGVELDQEKILIK